ncbi:WecB/TagA/CpsF family glycosyltransferase, partial [Patescibacteria group bacterium]|nr:WecB/TagA/CpsF family glycosyltransferase [Patescibacteria group bacterium]
GFLGGRERVAERTAECLKTRYPWIDVVFVGEEWPQVVKSSSYKVVKSSSRQVVKSSSRQVVKSSSRQVVKSSSDSENGHEGFGLEDLKTSIPIMDILFVAFGHPKQEEWIYENLEHLPVKVAMGVGGAFDYISGRVERAPFMIRAMGMEWLYRLIKEPWRWRRQLALGRFVWLVVKKFIKL